MPKMEFDIKVYATSGGELLAQSFYTGTSTTPTGRRRVWLNASRVLDRVMSIHEARYGELELYRVNGQEVKSQKVCR